MNFRSITLHPLSLHPLKVQWINSNTNSFMYLLTQDMAQLILYLKHQWFAVTTAEEKSWKATEAIEGQRQRLADFPLI